MSTKPDKTDEITADEAGRKTVSAIKGPIVQPEMSLTAKQLETVRAINKANHEFWDARALPPPPPEASTHPGVPPLVAQAHIMNLRESVRETRARTEATAESTIQSRRAKKPRPKKRSTYRNVVIAGIRAWRREGLGTFKEFLDSAEGGRDRFSIKPESKHSDRYIIECEDADVAEPKKPIKLSTLIAWWNEAA